MAIRSGGPAPVELTNLIICETMRWSWRELMETPAEMVDDLIVLLKKRQLIAQERAQLAEAAHRTRRR